MCNPPNHVIHRDETLPVVRCFERAAIARHTVVEPPPNTDPRVASRHLVELFSWAPARSLSQRERILVWKIVEVGRRNVETLEVNEVMRDCCWVWAPNAGSTRVDARVHFEMTAGGDVVWRFSSTGIAGMISALPIEIAPHVPDDLLSLPTSGAARKFTSPCSMRPARRCQARP